MGSQIKEIEEEIMVEFINKLKTVSRAPIKCLVLVTGDKIYYPKEMRDYEIGTYLTFNEKGHLVPILEDGRSHYVICGVSTAFMENNVK
jgi:hypothetical protein